MSAGCRVTFARWFRRGGNAIPVQAGRYNAKCVKGREIHRQLDCFPCGFYRCENKSNLCELLALDVSTFQDSKKLPTDLATSQNSTIFKTSVNYVFGAILQLFSMRFDVRRWDTAFTHERPKSYFEKQIHDRKTTCFLT